MFPSTRPLASPALARERSRQRTEPGLMARNTQDKMPGNEATARISFGLNIVCRTPPIIAMTIVGTSSRISLKWKDNKIDNEILAQT